MAKHINNLGTAILYEAPTTFSLLFAGAAFYLSEGDPSVRNQLESTKSQLRHWSKMYNWGLINMSILAGSGSAAALAAYFKSKQVTWLVGGSVMFAIIPYTLALMMKTNKYLEGVLQSTTGPQVNESERQNVIDSFKKWVKLHRGRAILALTAAGIFFVAKQYTKNSE